LRTLRLRLNPPVFPLTSCAEVFYCNSNKQWQFRAAVAHLPPALGRRTFFDISAPRGGGADSAGGIKARKRFGWLSRVCGVAPVRPPPCPAARSDGGGPPLFVRPPGPRANSAYFRIFQPKRVKTFPPAPAPAKATNRGL
jgi:hypothetical protein